MERKEVTIEYDDLLRLRDQFDLGDIPGARFSSLFVTELHLHDRYTNISASSILDAVRGLHGLARAPSTKRPARFRRAPLAGLWHVHFFDPLYIVENLRLQWRSRRDGQEWLAGAIDSVCDASGEAVFTEAVLNNIAREAVEGALDAREENHRLTGEWIIFAKHGGLHYYLTVARHKEADAKVYRRIWKFASQEFPELGLSPPAQ